MPSLLYDTKTTTDPVLPSRWRKTQHPSSWCLLTSLNLYINMFPNQAGVYWPLNLYINMSSNHQATSFVKSAGPEFSIVLLAGLNDIVLFFRTELLFVITWANFWRQRPNIFCSFYWQQHKETVAASKTHEFSEKSKAVFDPPHFRNNM